MSNNQLIFLVWTLLAGIYAGYKFTAWREWWDWLNPLNLKGGLVDGRLIRAKEFAKDAKLRSEKAANERVHERMNEIVKDMMVDTRRAGGHLRFRTGIVQGEVSAHVCAPDAEFLRRYGSPKTMTLKTLERLIEERKAAKDAEYEQGF